jgi:hypothetical protein
LAVLEDAHVPAASGAGAIAGVSVSRLASSVPLASSVSASDGFRLGRRAGNTSPSRV